MSIWVVQIEARDSDHLYVEAEYEIEAPSQDEAEEEAIDRLNSEYDDIQDIYIRFSGEI
jgi:hypothetical protein